MVMGKLPVPGRPTIWITVGQGPTALAVGAGGGCLDIFILIYSFSPLSPLLNVLIILTLLCMLMISVSFINRKIWRI